MTSLRAALSGTEVFFSAPRAASRARAHTYRCHAIVYKQASKQASKQATCYTTLTLFAPRSSTSLCFEKRKKRKKRRTERESKRKDERASAREREQGRGEIGKPESKQARRFPFCSL